MDRRNHPAWEHIKLVMWVVLLIELIVFGLSFLFGRYLGYRRAFTICLWLGIIIGACFLTIFLEPISKKSFGPNSALGARIKSSKYRVYSSGLIFAPALIFNQNPFFEIGSSQSAGNPYPLGLPRVVQIVS